MSRANIKSCKICRREGEKLFLKGERCYSGKCSFAKRSYGPGPHGKMSRKHSEYGLRLREKQKARRIYGLTERQFKKYFSLARRQKGMTGENLLIILEKRFDNVIYRLNLASSRKEARLLVTHGHFLINSRRSNIPSAELKTGDKISLKERSKERFKLMVEKMKDKHFPGWLSFDPETLTGQVMTPVLRNMIDTPLEERLIVEHYSR